MPTCMQRSHCQLLEYIFFQATQSIVGKIFLQDSINRTPSTEIPLTPIPSQTILPRAVGTIKPHCSTCHSTDLFIANFFGFRLTPILGRKQRNRDIEYLIMLFVISVRWWRNEGFIHTGYNLTRSRAMAKVGSYHFSLKQSVATGAITSSYQNINDHINRSKST